MPIEVPLTLTPQQAAQGVVQTVQLSTGPLTVRIPPVPDGALITAPTAQGEVLIRIHVVAAARPPANRGPRAGLLAFLGLAAVVALVFAFNHHGSSSSASSGSSSPTPYSYARPTDTYSPPAAPTYHYVPPVPRFTLPPITLAPPPALPHTTGTCLNGTIPDSTTPVTVSNVHEVACSASDAHYKVIQVFYATSDMEKCRSIDGTEYTFSERMTRGGVTLNQYVYCLKGLGSYAR
ncbi:LppU/SCO3897 family protein [Streptomyces orinoci]|uniref:Uncharacterized protein n=1 Tax=Streptomyces orinoci TaxID=67339 RepID=A0ABV3JQT7_STRON|nr:hypothetical protein [Streptomyces orinoci]